MERETKVLLINTQFVELYVSGFTNRFIGLWCYYQKNKRHSNFGKIHWVTNRSLWTKYFNEKPIPEDVTVLKADLKYFKFTSRLLYPFYLIYLFYRKKCTSVHIATSIIDSLYLVRLFNLFNIPYCFTFASNSLEMASYNNERMKRKWQKLFSLAKNIEVLNPTNQIENFKGTKYVSPTSFPYIEQFNDLPEELLVNPRRQNTIVFCGSFVSQKNPLFAIKGFEWYLKNFTNRPKDVKLKMIGRGELMNMVREEIQRVNTTYDGCFIEMVPESNLIQTLSSSKIFLSLQDYDNYPSQAVMEAMLFCNSIIATNYGDTSKLVDINRNNILLPEKNPELLGTAINELLGDWSLNKKNKELIKEKFSPEIFARYIFDLHKKIIQRN
jgi:glycosyltransferase involved in cell wall biosynthesis